MDHTAATCPLFATATAAVAATRDRESPAERLAALFVAIPPTSLSAPVLALLRELQAQMADLRQELAEVRVSLDMEGL